MSRIPKESERGSGKGERFRAPAGVTRSSSPKRVYWGLFRGIIQKVKKVLHIIEPAKRDYSRVRVVS